MRRGLPSLNALRAFDVAARRNSFKLAADELHVTPAAVSYQINSLESFLGVELFRRDNRSMYLTEAGQIIADGIAEGFERIAQTLDRLDEVVQARSLSAKTHDVLTLDVAPAFASKWLMPRLHRFTSLVPDIDVRILARRELVDFSDDSVDIAIRFGHGRYSGLHVVKLFDEAVTPVCSPRRMGGIDGTLSEPGDLSSQVLLHDDSYFFTDLRPDWDMWLKAAKIDGIDTRSGPRFSLSELAVQASIEDCGVALARVGLTRDDVESGRLVYPFDLILFLNLGYYLVGPGKVFKKAKVRKFQDWLLKEAEDFSDERHRNAVRRSGSSRSIQ